MPHFDNPAVLFTDIAGYNDLKMQRVQNACVRFVTGASRYDHVTPHYVELGMLKLEKRRTLAVANMIFKIINTRTPSYLFNKYQFTSSRNMCDTRSSKLQLLIPIHRTEKYHQSFLIQSSKLWNELHLYNYIGKTDNYVKCIVQKYLLSDMC